MSEPTPRPRFRVSLLSLMLVTAVVGLSIAVGMLWREVGPLRARYFAETKKSAELGFELRRLRASVGDIDIRDKATLQVAQLATHSQAEQLFIVWVPEGEKYALRYAEGRLPIDGVPERGTTAKTLQPGRRTVDYWAQRDEVSGEVSAKLRTDDNVTVPMPTAWLTSWTRGSSPWAHCEVVRSTTRHDTGEPVVLLRHFTESPASDAEQANGFMIWLEPVP